MVAVALETAAEENIQEPGTVREKTDMPSSKAVEGLGW